MVTNEIFQDLLAFFENGHIKNVQNRFLESLSHAEIHEFSISSPPQKKDICRKWHHFTLFKIKLQFKCF